MMLSVAFVILLAGPCMGGDLVSVLSNEPKASTLLQLVVEAGIADVFKTGVHTVFAPTDAAFNRLPPATLDYLRKTENKDELIKILSYHVVNGGIYANDIKNEETYKTLTDDKIRFNVYTHGKGLIDVNGVKVSDADNKASNGVVHFIDAVLNPPATKTLVDLVAADPELSTLLSLVQKAGLANTVLSDPLTLFAPTNDAFKRLSASDTKKLVNDAERLKQTLLYHAVPHTLFANSLYNNEFPHSADDKADYIRIRVRDSGVNVNNGKVVAADIQGTNGVIHKIDHVLIPLSVGFWLRTGIGRK